MISEQSYFFNGGATEAQNINQESLTFVIITLLTSMSILYRCSELENLKKHLVVPKVLKFFLQASCPIYKKNLQMGSIKID